MIVSAGHPRSSHWDPPSSSPSGHSSPHLEWRKPMDLRGFMHKAVDVHSDMQRKDMKSNFRSDPSGLHTSSSCDHVEKSSNTCIALYIPSTHAVQPSTSNIGVSCRCCSRFYIKIGKQLSSWVENTDPPIRIPAFLSLVNEHGSLPHQRRKISCHTDEVDR